MNIEEIKEARRIAKEKISYELDLLERRCGLVITGMGATRQAYAPLHPESTFLVEIDMQLPD